MKTCDETSKQARYEQVCSTKSHQEFKDEISQIFKQQINCKDYQPMPTFLEGQDVRLFFFFCKSLLTPVWPLSLKEMLNSFCILI